MVQFIQVTQQGTKRRFTVNVDHIRAISDSEVRKPGGYIELSGDGHALEVVETQTEINRLLRQSENTEMLEKTR